MRGLGRDLFIPLDLQLVLIFPLTLHHSPLSLNKSTRGRGRFGDPRVSNPFTGINEKPQTVLRVFSRSTCSIGGDVLFRNLFSSTVVAPSYPDTSIRGRSTIFTHRENGIIIIISMYLVNL